MVSGLEQHDPAGVFEIVDRGGDGFDLLQDGVPQHRFDLTPRRLDDFAEACLFHQTSPQSHFTRNTVCSIRTDAGRVTLRGSGLIETTSAGRTERQLAPDELTDVYATYFGILLDGPSDSRGSGA